MMNTPAWMIGAKIAVSTAATIKAIKNLMGVIRSLTL
jgi:hypothetical protein